MSESGAAKEFCCMSHFLISALAKRQQRQPLYIICNKGLKFSLNSLLYLHSHYWTEITYCTIHYQMNSSLNSLFFGNSKNQHCQRTYDDCCTQQLLKVENAIHCFYLYMHKIDTLDSLPKKRDRQPFAFAVKLRAVQGSRSQFCRNAEKGQDQCTSSTSSFARPQTAL